MASEILIVGHGAGRGRHPGQIFGLVADLMRRAPAFHRTIRVHTTGSGGTPDLRGVRAVLFWLADPLRELYPACFAEAVEIARRARDAGARIVNPPEALSNSIKSVQAALWTAAGIPTPAHRRFETRAALDALADDLRYPVIVKSDLLHAQARMRVCSSAAELRALPADAVPVPGSVVALVDTREGYRATAPGSIWARFYHKKRLMVLGDVVHPRHVIFARSPIVGLKTSTIRRYGGEKARPLRPDDAVARACIAADNAYWTGAPEQPELMRAACRALGLDIAAIDYATFADGRVVLWEANPYFFLFSAANYILPRERRFEERYQAFYDALRRFLEGLLALPQDSPA